MRSVDFDVFVVIWNNLQRQSTPSLHIRIVRWLQENWLSGRRELLLMAFRNSGKSTLVGLFCAWLLSREPDLRIMVLAADLSLARKMARNVKKIIETHPLTRGLKPRRADQWASDQFTVVRAQELRDPSMLARGIGANMTGSRADIIICDDVEVPNTSDSAPKRLDLRTRLSEIEYVLVPGGLQLYVGTPHTYYTIYAKDRRSEAGEERAFLSGFERLEIPILNPEGRSLWPDRFPISRIDAIRARSGPAKFQSQMMLEPVNIIEGRLDPNRLRVYDDQLVYREGNGEAELVLNDRRLVSASCWWDPSYGSPGSGDASVIACIFTDEEGSYFLHAMEYMEHVAEATAQVDEATQLCHAVAAFTARHHLPSVRIETNGIGKFLPGLLRRELATNDDPVAVIEETSSRAKDLRILDAFDPILAAARLHAHRSIWETPFVQEMREWRPGTKGRDDGLDAVAGCLLSEPVRLRAHPPERLGAKTIKPSWRGTDPFTVKSDFDL